MSRKARRRECWGEWVDEFTGGNDSFLQDLTPTFVIIATLSGGSSVGVRNGIDCSLWRQKSERYYVRVERFTDWRNRRVSGAFGNHAAGNEWNLCADA